MTVTVLRPVEVRIPGLNVPKSRMLAFADAHFEVLSAFGRRVGTGTTGQRLNELAWTRGWPRDIPWIERYQSGPLGGDAQIADQVLERHCHRAVFPQQPPRARPSICGVRARAQPRAKKNPRFWRGFWDKS